MNWCRLIQAIILFVGLSAVAQPDGTEELAARLRQIKLRAAKTAMCNQVTDSLQNALKSDLAYRFLQSLLKHYGTLPGDSFTPDLYNHIGNFYNSTANYSRALDMFNKSRALFTQQKRAQGQCSAITNMGNSYFYLRNYDKALACYKEALALNERIAHDETTASNLYNNVGIIYSMRGNRVMGMNFFKKALSVYVKQGDSLSISQAYNNFATAFQHHGEYDSALYYYHEALRLKEKFGSRRSKLDAFHNLAEIYFNKGDYAKSMQFIRKAIALHDTSVFSVDLEYTYRLLSEIYEVRNSMGLALRYYKLSKSIRDSIDARNKMGELMQRVVSMEVSKTHLADSLAMAEETRIRNIELAQQQRENRYLIVLLVIAAGTALLLYNRFRVTRRQKRIIAEQKLLVEHKQKEVLDSIHYARRIQGSLLTSEKYIARCLRQLRQKK